MARRRAARTRTRGERNGRGDLPAPGSRDLIVRTKLRPPSRRSDSWIRRDRLLARLAQGRDRELVLVDAPVGYGKTGLLSDWAASEATERWVAWVSLDPLDSDPNRCLAHLVAAIRQAFPRFGQSVEAALRVPSSLGAPVVSHLINELSELPAPILLILDDYHHLRGEAIHGSMAELLDRLPPTVQLAIATRSDPPLPLGRLRASGEVLELRAADLALDEVDLEALLAASNVSLSRPALRELLDRLEGWPAGAYLAAVALRDEPDSDGFVDRFTGSHRHIADYLTEEVLRRQPDDVRNFLTRTSIFDRFSAELCDAVLERKDSQLALDQLEHWNLFLVGLDDHRQWYRYHHLFRELLATDLARREPAAVATLHRRAGTWFASHGLVQEGIDHMLKGDDRPQAGRLVSRYWRVFLNSGRVTTVRAWFAALGETVKADPAVALSAAWVAALGGEAERVPALLAVAEDGSEAGPLPDGTASLEAGAALVRGIFGFDGFRQMEASLRRADELESSPDSPWRGYILVGLGLTAFLKGNTEQARALLRQGLRLAPEEEAVARLLLLSQLSMVEGELRNANEAVRLAGEARRIGDEAGLSEDPRFSVAMVAMGAAHKERGELVAAEAELDRALVIRTANGAMNPWVTLQGLVLLAPVKFALGDRDEARRLLDRARGMLARLDKDRDVVRLVEKAERAIRASAHRLEFGQTLTERELAVLSLLPTGHNQRDIARELFLSLNTVKSHTRAIYRKLGVTSRSEAVARARDLGLV